MTTYTVRMERDEDGWWVATVEGVPGCHSQGKTLATAEARAREALALFVGDRKAKAATLERKVDLPPALAMERTRVTIAADRAARAAADSRETAVRVTAAFVEAGYSTRDVGALLGVSAQRVSQRAALAKAEPRPADARRKAAGRVAAGKMAASRAAGHGVRARKSA